MKSDETTTEDQILVSKVTFSPVKISNDSYRRYGKELETELVSNTRPNNYLDIVVTREGYPYVSGRVDNIRQLFSVDYRWNAQNYEIQNCLNQLYQSVKRFRENHSDYLNDIDATSLLNKLQNPAYFKACVLDHLDGISNNILEDKWNQIATCSELKELAFYGHNLYEEFFRRDTALRNAIDSLPPGTMIQINWLPECSGWIRHIPWSLMFQSSPPTRREAIDPLYFMGLRYRIEYINHPSVSKPESLGSLSQSYRMHYLYWGDGLDPQEKELAQEIRWLRQELTTNWVNQKFIPELNSTDRKGDLLDSLRNPLPKPVNLLYFHCYYEKVRSLPALCFGATNDQNDTVAQSELTQENLPDNILVFINACSTLASVERPSHDLEKIFFKRGCLAYLGTESEIPIVFSSRFAMTFFNLFYGSTDVEPMKAGEAVFQARLFLWRNYRNIGGLLYGYVGLYGLYLSL